MWHTQAWEACWAVVHQLCETLVFVNSWVRTKDQPARTFSPVWFRNETVLNSVTFRSTQAQATKNLEHDRCYNLTSVHWQVIAHVSNFALYADEQLSSLPTAACRNVESCGTHPIRSILSFRSWCMQRCIVASFFFFFSFAFPPPKKYFEF